MNENIIEGEIGFDITIKSIQDKKSFVLNSYGGDLYTGLALFDYVKSSDIEVGVIGMCASAATLPLLASSKRWGTPNSRYLIHNPWSMVMGDAQDMQKNANDLKIEQDRAYQLYVDNLTASPELIKEYMDQERMLNAEEALAIGLILEIKNFNEKSRQVEGSDIKSMFNNFKMMYNMNDEKEVQKDLSGIKSLLEKISKFLFVKMLVLQDVNGMELNFGDDIESIEEVQVGTTATVSGSPANGDYVMPSGETFTFEGGSVVAIIPVEEVVEAEAELEVQNEALVAEVAMLKETNLKMESEKAKLESDLEVVRKDFTEVKNQFDKFQNQFSSEKPKDVSPEGEKKTDKRVSFNFNKKK